MSRPHPVGTKAVADLRPPLADKERLIAALEKIHSDLNDGKVEEAHDAVLDLLDALTGWCHPNARLFA